MASLPARCGKGHYTALQPDVKKTWENGSLARRESGTWGPFGGVKVGFYNRVETFRLSGACQRD